MLLSILSGTYTILTIINTMTGVAMSQSLRGRISLAFLFIFTGIGHFLMPEGMAQMLPDFVPLRVEIIYASGIFEILAGIALLVPRLSRLTAIVLILFLIAILPSNIYAAFARIDFGGHEAGPVYLLVRVPLQLLFIGWAYYFGIHRNESD